jgi:glycosyltransferase involved in cell wall biosynthesis
MKIAFLAGHSTIHTVKWVNEMAGRGNDVYLITMHPGTEELNKNINVYKLPFNAPLGYYFNVWHLEKLLKRIQPDILNTHYASGYGTLARLSGFRPNLLSVWGSDVFDFPYMSKYNMKVIRKNLRSAYRIASISNIMKNQTESLYKPQKEIVLTPFGVDCEKFKSIPINQEKNSIRIGTIKRMDPKYGISTLIEAFALVKRQVKEKIELILIGGGPQEEELKLLVRKLDLRESVQFIGSIPHHSVPEWLNSFDIYGALSTLDSESFGVAIIEASACGVPVIVSDAGGLPEVVVDGQTGYIVPRNNPQAAAEKIVNLINDKNARVAMGRAGREFVLKTYEWKENADRMEKLYKEIIHDYKK